jgi:hypothetical protein
MGKMDDDDADDAAYNFKEKEERILFNFQPHNAANKSISK